MACHLFIYGILWLVQPALKDINSYYNHVETASLRLDRFVDVLFNHPIAALLGEPVWFLGLAALGAVSTPEVTIWIVSCFSFSLLVHALSKATGCRALPLLFVVAMYPLAIKYLFQIRQGLAISVFFWGYASFGKSAARVRYAAPLIHHGAWIYPIAEAIVRTLRRIKLSRNMWPQVGAVVAGVVVLLLPVLISVVEQRATRVSEGWTFAAPDSSGEGAAFWFALMVAVYLLGKVNQHMALFWFGAAVFVIGQFSFDASGRLFHFFLPFLALCVPAHAIRRLVYMYLVLIAGVILWVPTVMDLRHIVSSQL